MAKIRVYEFARTLNIQNKILLEKLRNMGISVKSHMSSLDEETVARTKAELFGPKPQDVEVTRVKPTIIRRRKKPVEAKVDAEVKPLKEVTPLEKKVQEKP
ncbi:MAG: translation initiation factor IF-2 N-terminal domain-containing protein, partial [Desulfobacterales bacterium]